MSSLPPRPPTLEELLADIRGGGLVREPLPYETQLPERLRVKAPPPPGQPPRGIFDEALARVRGQFTDVTEPDVFGNRHVPPLPSVEPETPDPSKIQKDFEDQVFAGAKHVAANGGNVEDYVHKQHINRYGPEIASMLKAGRDLAVQRLREGATDQEAQAAGTELAQRHITNLQNRLAAGELGAQSEDTATNVAGLVASFSTPQGILRQGIPIAASVAGGAAGGYAGLHLGVPISGAWLGGAAGYDVGKKIVDVMEGQPTDWESATLSGLVYGVPLGGLGAGALTKGVVNPLARRALATAAHAGAQAIEMPARGAAEAFAEGAPQPSKIGLATQAVTGAIVGGGMAGLTPIEAERQALSDRTAGETAAAAKPPERPIGVLAEKTADQQLAEIERSLAAARYAGDGPAIETLEKTRQGILDARAKGSEAPTPPVPPPPGQAGPAPAAPAAPEVPPPPGAPPAQPPEGAPPPGPVSGVSMRPQVPAETAAEAAGETTPAESAAARQAGTTPQVRSLTEAAHAEAAGMPPPVTPPIVRGPTGGAARGVEVTPALPRTPAVTTEARPTAPGLPTPVPVPPVGAEAPRAPIEPVTPRGRRGKPPAAPGTPAEAGEAGRPLAPPEAPKPTTKAPVRYTRELPPGVEPSGAVKPTFQPGHRFRASVDIPLNDTGHAQMRQLGRDLAANGGVDEIYHDDLSRTSMSADILQQENPRATMHSVGIKGQSQALGRLEGQEVTPKTLKTTQDLVENPNRIPGGRANGATRAGESFNQYLRRYLPLIDQLREKALKEGKVIALVTHNRNIQTENARLAEQGARGRGLKIDPEVMKEPGPKVGTVNKVVDHATEDWTGKKLDPGLYLVRHGETDWNLGEGQAPKLEKAAARPSPEEPPPTKITPPKKPKIAGMDEPQRKAVEAALERVPEGNRDRVRKFVEDQLWRGLVMREREADRDFYKREFNEIGKKIPNRAAKRAQAGRDLEQAQSIYEAGWDTIRGELKDVPDAEKIVRRLQQVSEGKGIRTTEATKEPELPLTRSAYEAVRGWDEARGLIPMDEAVAKVQKYAAENPRSREDVLAGLEGLSAMADDLSPRDLRMLVDVPGVGAAKIRKAIERGPGDPTFEKIVAYRQRAEAEQAATHELFAEHADEAIVHPALQKVADSLGAEKDLGHTFLAGVKDPATGEQVTPEAAAAAIKEGKGRLFARIRQAHEDASERFEEDIPFDVPEGATPATREPGADEDTPYFRSAAQDPLTEKLGPPPKNPSREQIEARREAAMNEPPLERPAPKPPTEGEPQGRRASELPEWGKPSPDWWGRRVQYAEARMKERVKGTQMNVGVDPRTFWDAFVLGADAIRKGAIRFGDWMKKLVTTIPDFRSWGSRVWDYLKGLGAPVVVERRGRPAPFGTVAAGREALEAPERARPLQPIRTVPKLSPEQLADAVTALDRGGPVERGAGKPVAIGHPEDLAINVNQVVDENGIRDNMTRLIRQAEDTFDLARRTYTAQELKTLALKLGYSEADYLRMLREKGSLTAAEIIAGRRLRQAAGIDFGNKRAAYLDAVSRAQEANLSPEEFQKRSLARLDAEREQLASLSKFSAMMLGTAAAGAEAGRALWAHKMLVSSLTPEEIYLQKLFRTGKADEQQTAALAKAFAEGDNEAVSRIIRRIFKPGLMKMAVEYFINSLLSGPATSVANVTGNLVHEAALRTPERGIAARLEQFGIRQGIERLLTGEAKPTERVVGEAMEALRAQVRHKFGLLSSLDMARQALTHEDLRFLQSVKGEPMTPGAIPGLFGKIVRTPGRVMEALDIGAKIAASQAEKAAQLWRMAYEQHGGKGIGSTEFRAHLADLHGRMDQWIALEETRRSDPKAFQEHYGADGYTFLYANRELADVHRAMAQAADVSTFRDQTTRFSNFIKQMRGAYPWLTFVVPFVHTSERILVQGFRRTPLGLLKSLYNIQRGKLSGGEASDRLAQGMLGTAITAATYMLAADGHITGGGPNDPRERENWLKIGKLPYAIKLGNTWVSYGRIEPFATIFGLASDLAEARNEKTAGDAFGKLHYAIINNVTNKTYLEGIVSASEAIGNPDRYMARYWKRSIGALVPNLLASATRAIDPTIRETDDMSQVLMSRVPVLSATLPPRLTGTGEIATRPETAISRFVSPVRYNEEGGPERNLERMFLETGYSPSQPPKSITIPGTLGRKVQLERPEREIYAAYASRATAFARGLTQNADFSRLDAYGKEEFLRRIFNFTHDAAQRAMLASAMGRLARGGAAIVPHPGMEAK